MWRELILGRREIKEIGLQEGLIKEAKGLRSEVNVVLQGSCPRPGGRMSPIPRTVIQDNTWRSTGAQCTRKVCRKEISHQESFQIRWLLELGMSQHMEMSVAFWSGDKSMRKDTEKRQYGVMQGPLSSPAGMGPGQNYPLWGSSSRGSLIHDEDQFRGPQGRWMRDPLPTSQRGHILLKTTQYNREGPWPWCDFQLRHLLPVWP